jgi:hypothetical protein
MKTGAEGQVGAATQSVAAFLSSVKDALYPRITRIEGDCEPQPCGDLCDASCLVYHGYPNDPFADYTECPQKLEGSIMLRDTPAMVLASIVVGVSLLGASQPPVAHRIDVLDSANGPAREKMDLREWSGNTPPTDSGVATFPFRVQLIGSDRGRYALGESLVIETRLTKTGLHESAGFPVRASGRRMGGVRGPGSGGSIPIIPFVLSKTGGRVSASDPRG